MSHRSKDQLLNGTAVACGASATTVISNPTRVTSAMSMNPYAEVWCSAMAVTNGITFKWQTSLDGVYWETVGGGTAASTKKTATGGTAEVTTVTFPATAGATQADYLSVTAQDGSTFAVWLDIDAAGTAPSGALYVAATNKIKVSIVTGGTAAQNAVLARAAVVANAAWAAAFTTGTTSTDHWSVTQKLTGAVTDMAPKSANDGGAGSITISVGTQGSNGGVDTTADTITSTTHGFVTGQAIIYTAGTTAVAGLTTATVYYAIRVDADTLSFATSYANAIAATAIDLTGYGSGTQAFYAARYTLQMNIQNSTDEAYLPLLPLTQLVAVNGASDTCTVSNAYVIFRDE